MKRYIVGIFSKGKLVVAIGRPFYAHRRQLRFVDSFVGLLAKYIEPGLMRGYYVAFDEWVK